ncbi:M48 family metallopeptidase [Desulfovibrio sp. OttesenSCG-928-I05]|nr:M48 family metallopeptidase [Desulfovibrio sp. OttesenSCG-928-I05]
MFLPFKAVRNGGFAFVAARLLLVLLAFSFLPGCSTVPYTGRSQLMLLEPAEEMSLGLNAAREVRETEKIETGTRRSRLVQSVGKRIAEAAERPDFEWEFHTVVKEDVNAFCLPGGRVFFYTGILQLTGNNENEIAAIMGHEVAHALARHGAEKVSVAQMTAVGQVALDAALILATGVSLEETGGDSLFGLLANVGVLLPHSRVQESEADHIGLLLTAKAGYDPRAAITFWQKMQELNGDGGFGFLSTHPLTADRIASIEKDLPQALLLYEEAKKRRGKK